MVNSINTNASAYTALQVLNATSRALEQTQNRVNTGLRVAGARDDGAAYAIAQNIRGDVAGLHAAQNSLTRGLGVIDVALAAGESVSEILIDLRQKALMFQSAGSDAERNAVINEYNALLGQITSIIDNAEFSGTNLLKGSGFVITGSTFVESTPVAATPFRYMQTADFNEDGNLDIVTADHISSAVFVYMGDGAGGLTLGHTQATAFANRELAILDYDGDLHQDLLFMEPGQLSVSLGAGDGTFAAPVVVDTGTDVSTLQVADFNGDGVDDYAFARRSGMVGTNVGGAEVDVGAFGVTDTPQMSAADFDGDGDIDIALVNSAIDSLQILTNDGTGTFTVASTTAVGDAPSSIATGDLNRDGYLDLVVQNTADDTLSILLNDGSGGFTNVQTIASNDTRTLWSGNSLELTDFNNDGILDIAVGGGTDGTIQFFEGRGDATFKDAITYTTEVSIFGPTGLKSGDFNNDGLIDLAYGFFNTPFVGGIHLLTNQGATPDSPSNYAARFSVMSGTDGSQTTIDREPMTLRDLGLLELTLGTDIYAVISNLDAVITEVSLGLARLGTSSKGLARLLESNAILSDALDVGIGNLVDADMAKESAKLLALQVKQQLGIKALGIANSAPGLIMSLFER